MRFPAILAAQLQTDGEKTPMPYRYATLPYLQCIQPFKLKL